LFLKEKCDAIRPAGLRIPRSFAARNSDETDPYLGAWRAYYKALVDTGIYVGGDPLEVPENATTVRLKEGKRRVQDGPFADTKVQLAGFIVFGTRVA
jgi:hypothetical protein